MRRALTSTPKAALSPSRVARTRLSHASSARVQTGGSTDRAAQSWLAFRPEARADRTPSSRPSPKAAAVDSASSISSGSALIQANVAMHPATPSPEWCSQGASLSQAELDALVDGVEFDDDYSFEAATPPKPRAEEAKTSVSSASISLGARSTPRTPASAVGAAPSALVASTSRASPIAEVLTLGSSSPMRASSLLNAYSATQLREYSFSAKEPRYEKDDPLPDPPSDEGYFDQIAAAIEDAGRHSADDIEMIELSSDSEVEMAPIKLPRGKENAPSPSQLVPPPRTLDPAGPRPRVNRPGSVRGLDVGATIQPLVSTAPKRVYRGANYEKLQKKADAQALLASSYPTFDHSQWPQRPKVVYTKDEIVVSSVLSKMTGPLGFDLEWEPYSYGGLQGKTALAQVCDERTILLIHVAKMRPFPAALRRFVEDPKRIKLGVQISGDAQKLVRDQFAAAPSGMLELNDVAKAVDANHSAPGKFGLIGLQELVRKYLDRYLPKEAKVRKGKWASALGEDQRKYAANDVYSSLMVFLELASRAPEGVDVTAWASGASRRATGPQPPLAAGRPLAFTASQGLAGEPAGKPAKPSNASSGPTARQMEAYELWHVQGLSVAAATAKMSESRPIRAISTVWSVLGALAHHRPPLAYDAAKLLAAVAEVDGAAKGAMLEEHKELLAKAAAEPKSAQA